MRIWKEIKEHDNMRKEVARENPWNAKVSSEN